MNREQKTAAIAEIVENINESEAVLVVDYRGLTVTQASALRGKLREADATLYMPTAAAVVEVVSPDDESRQKFGHYAAHGVGEVLIVDPDTRTIELYVLGDDGEFAPASRSALTGVLVTDLVAAIRWPT